MRIRVNDIVLDSYETEIISQTLEVCSFENVSTRNGDFTNDFKLPLTPKNRSAIGYIDDFNSISRNQYTKVEAYLIDGSNEYKGYVRYKVISYGGNTEIIGTFFGSNSEWFNELKDKSLKDLDLSHLDHNWNENNIVSAIEANGSLGYDYTLIDYGRLKNYQSTDSNISVGHNFFYPQVKVDELVRAVYKGIGWSVDGSLFSEDRFQRMLQPFCDEDFVKSPSYVSSFTKVYNNFSVPDLDTDLQSETIKWAIIPAPLTELMQVDSSTYYKMTYSLTWSYTRTNPVGGLGVTMTGSLLYNEGPFLWIRPVAVDNLEEYSTFTYTIEVIYGRPVYLDLSSEIYSGLRINFSGGEQGVLSVTGASYTFEPIPEYLYNDTISMASTMPDVSQKDFLKHVFMCYGVIPQSNTVSKHVTLNLFNEAKQNIPNALDWSDKLDVSKTQNKDFTKLLSKYSRFSKISYAQDSEDVELEAYRKESGGGLGDGALELDNEHLSENSELYSSPYAATININALNNNINIPQIKWFDFEEGELIKVFDVKPKMLLRSDLLPLTELTFGAYDNLIITKDHGLRFKVEVNSGSISNIQIIEGSQYSRYDTPPVVLVSNPQDENGTTAQISLGLTSAGYVRTADITVVDAGSGYISAPEITLVTPLFNFDSTDAVSFNWFVKSQYLPEINSNYPYNLAFSDVLIPTNDSNLKEDYLLDFESTLSDMKGLDAYFKLNEIDINNLDYLMPIYIDRVKSYFIVNKIPDYRGVRQTTKVELIKIG